MKRIVFSLLPLIAACGSPSDERPPPTSAPEPDRGAVLAPGFAPAVVAARMAEPSTRSEIGDVNPRLLRRFKPLRPTLALADAPTPSRAVTDLGRMLFFDKRLSRDRDLSCNSCHRLDRYGVDNEPTSRGTRGVRGRRNSPTVYHAAGHFTAFWDGRSPNVEEQAKVPILSPAEMAMPDPAAVIARLERIPGYVEAFRTAFPDERQPLTYDNVGRAIGAFERNLVTPLSRWDRYLAGNKDVLSSQEVAGFKLFTDLGCVTCHTGEFVGGSMFQKVGIAAPWPNQNDVGRYEVTKLPSDRMLFKVPSLRDVVKTAPYFHDGSAKTLDEAVEMMARHQIGEELSERDVDSIVAWLGALTGDLPADYIQAPKLPAD